jgi:hypothetical protein
MLREVSGEGEAAKCRAQVESARAETCDERVSYLVQADPTTDRETERRRFARHFLGTVLMVAICADKLLPAPRVR